MSFANQSGIYAITNSVNGKMYAGSTVNFKKRWQGHLSRLRRGEHHSPAFQNAWNKHGADAFVFDVIEFVDPPRLIEREQVWLDFFKPVYNVARIAGVSMAGATHSSETKKKMSLVRRGRTFSIEHRARMSAVLAGNTRWLGRKHTAETRAKIGASKSGKARSAETREKISAARKGQRLSPEHKARISAGLVRRCERERSARLLMGDGAPG